jgi:hypothetical protein
MKTVVAVRLTAHATDMAKRRNITLEWIEDTLRMPISERIDERDPTLTLAFRQIPEVEGRWLRVVYRMEKSTHVLSPCSLTGTRRIENEDQVRSRSKRTVCEVL